jgi:hypothetical protein
MAVLDLQARVAKEVAKCGNVLADIDQCQQQAVSGFWYGTAVWSGELWAGAGPGLLERVRRTSIAFLQDGLDYLHPKECRCTWDSYWH